MPLGIRNPSPNPPVIPEKAPNKVNVRLEANEEGLRLPSRVGSKDQNKEGTERKETDPLSLHLGNNKEANPKENGYNQ